MIRIHLTSDAADTIEIADTPDFSAELVRAGHLLANGMRLGRLSTWKTDVAKGWNPEMARLFDLYSASVAPGIFDRAVHPDPGATAKAVAATDPARFANYLRNLTRSRRMTPFTRALADGRESAYTELGQTFEQFQTVAVDPYRRRMTAVVAAAAARADARAATSGPDGLLNTLHPLVSWEQGKAVLGLKAHIDCDFELAGRSLVLRPTVFAVRPGHSGDMFDDKLVVYYPATDAALARDPAPGAPSRALAALLGPTRAAALVAIARTPALTTGQLAEQLGLSVAAASRQATVLREADLIISFRDGMAVRHQVTRLGDELAGA